MMQITAFYETIVDKEELFSPVFLGKFRFANKSLNIHNFGFFINRNQFFIGFSRKNINNTLSEIRRRQIVHFASVMVKSKMNIWMCQSYTLKFIHNMTKFNRIRFQEIASCRNIKK